MIYATDQEILSEVPPAAGLNAVQTALRRVLYWSGDAVQARKLRKLVKSFWKALLPPDAVSRVRP